MNLQIEEWQKLHSKVLRENPFYAWQCVTLITESRTYDFVFECETDIMIFINFIQHVVVFNKNKILIKKSVDAKLQVPTPMSKFFL
jgi:hypothetical protein